MGAVCIFVGVAMLAPAVARPLSGVIGRPLAGALGEAGKLGRKNSMRSPRRTAQTASALMVGIALVSAIAVFGASVSKSATASVKEAISADLLISASSGGLADSVPARASAVPGVTTSATIYRDQFEFKGSLETLTSAPPDHLSDTDHLAHGVRCSEAALAGGEILIDSTTARSDHLSVGDLAPVKFAATGPTKVRIGGVYEANTLIGSYLVSNSYFLAHFVNEQPGAVLLRTNGSSGVDKAVQNALSELPERKGPDPGPVRAGPDQRHQSAAGPDLRPPRPGRVDRPDRDRQHTDAVGVRAHPGDRAAAGGGHEAPAGPEPWSGRNR